MYMIFASVTPLFIIILAGVLVECLQVLPDGAVRTLSIFSLYISIPCLIFHVMCTAPLEKLVEWRWWLGILLVQVGFLGIFYAIERRLRRESGPAMISALTVAFCNAGFVGLPVIINVYNGDDEVIMIGGLMMVSSNIICIIAQTVVMAYARRQREQAETRGSLRLYSRIWHFIRNYFLYNSVFMATLLGFLVCLSGISVWEPLDKSLSMLGFVAPTCMLFTLGLSLRPSIIAALRSREVRFAHQTWLCLWRLVGMPLISLPILLALGVDPLWVSVSTIMLATGSAIFCSALAQLYQCVPGQAALTVAVTNTLSLFSLIGILALLTSMGFMPEGFSFD